MRIREYQESDYFYLQSILFEYGIPHQDHKFDIHHTFILGDREAFFTYRMDGEIPHLVHFAVKREKRSNEMARVLIKSYQSVLRNIGFKTSIIHSRQRALSKFIEYYFKVKPYAEEGIYKFYLVEV